MGVKITNIEYYLPEKIITNDQLTKQFPDWTPDKIERKIGIKERHIAKKNETALDLALIAGKKILENYDKDKIDFLLLCTQSPEYYMPSGACILQDRLGLNKNIGAFDYNLGCSGFIYGLANAKAFINSKIANNILLITSDTISKYLNHKDIGNMIIFGDAAGATIIEKSKKEQIGEFVLGTDGSGYKNLIVPNGGLRHQYNPKAKEINDDSGNIRTDNIFYMNGIEVFSFGINIVPKVTKEILNKNKLILNDINYTIFHQANKCINKYLREKIGIQKDKYYLNLLYTGNTSSCTIPIAIKNSLDKNIIKKGNKILIIGFGSGYSWGGTVIEI